MKTKKGKKQRILGNKKRVLYNEEQNDENENDYLSQSQNEDNEEFQEYSENSGSNKISEEFSQNDSNDENEHSNNNEEVDNKDILDLQTKNKNKSKSENKQNKEEEISIELRTSQNIVKQQEIYYSFIGLRILFQDILNIANNLPINSNANSLDDVNQKIIQNLELTLVESEKNMDNLMNTMINRINKPMLLEKGIDSSSKKPNVKFIKKYSNKIIDSWYKKTINSMNSNVGSLTQNLEDGLHNYYLNYIKKSNYKQQLSEGIVSIDSKNEVSKRYDDTDFYSLLLKDFINFNSSLNLENPDDANEVDNILQQETLLRLRNQKERKSKISSSKLSKNRAINYQVHEKLTNFMAPEEYGDKFYGRKEILNKLFGIKWSDIIDNKDSKEIKDTKENTELTKSLDNNEFKVKIQETMLHKKQLKNKSIEKGKISKSKLSDVIIESDNEDVKLL